MSNTITITLDKSDNNTGTISTFFPGEMTIGDVVNTINEASAQLHSAATKHFQHKGYDNLSMVPADMLSECTIESLDFIK